MNDLLRFKFDQKFAVFDGETSNLAIVSEKPWQFAWLTAKGKYVTNKFERKILWKDYSVKPEIAVFNHFDEQQYLREARDPAEVLDELESVLYDPSYMSVSMNGLGFDCYIINNWR